MILVVISHTILGGVPGIKAVQSEVEEALYMLQCLDTPMPHVVSMHVQHKLDETHVMSVGDVSVAL